MSYARLLAKSSHDPDAPREPETLPGHLRAVTGVAKLLAEEWGECYLASLGLDVKRFGPRLRMALPRSAFAHDLGKASDHFQRAVRCRGAPATQAARHEQLSLWLLLNCSPLAEWLFSGCDAWTREAVLVAILGHHMRAADQRDLQLRHGSGALHIVLHSGHPDFAVTLMLGADKLGLESPPTLADTAIDLLEPEAYDLSLARWLLEAGGWWRSAGEEEKRFLAVLKALVVSADVAGSALPRLGQEPATWVGSALRRTATPQELASVAERRLGGATPRRFQQQVADSASRVAFVRAGCGTGKTIAAYLWAVRRAAGRKLFFCYPTTGTASQGFADYTPPDEFEAALVHSRAGVDLEELLAGTDEDRLEWLLRFASLVTWDARITVCTVDAVLGLVQNSRRALFGFPPIANGAFVFDEVHQYDDRLFRALLRFLEAFRGVPVLLMTASLPGDRLHALEKVLVSTGQQLEVIEGPEELEALKRYRLRCAGLQDVWSQVTAAVEGGERVLWVSNTVDRAVALAREAEIRGLAFVPYHSRYRYGDRLQRHAQVIAAFASAPGLGVLATTTQVCEVSLDISAGLLVTDLAPIPALIQRLGRLNRRLIGGTVPHPAPALVLQPGRPEPYASDDLEQAQIWLQRLGEAPCSQADLAAVFERPSDGSPTLSTPLRSAWLDGGATSGQAALREEGMTIPVVREEDLKLLVGLAADRRANAVIRATVPMPFGPVARETGGWRREGVALIAPAGRMHYDERFGGRWR